MRLKILSVTAQNISCDGETEWVYVIRKNKRTKQWEWVFHQEKKPVTSRVDSLTNVVQMTAENLAPTQNKYLRSLHTYLIILNLTFEKI